MASDFAGKLLLLVVADSLVARSAAWVFHSQPPAATETVAVATVWASWMMAISTAPHSPAPKSAGNARQCHK